MKNFSDINIVALASMPEDEIFISYLDRSREEIYRVCGIDWGTIKALTRFESGLDVIIENCKRGGPTNDLNPD